MTNPNTGESWHTEMATLIRQLTPDEGDTGSLWDGVRLIRMNRPVRCMPVLCERSIVIVCQGGEHGYLAGRAYHYDAQHYLVLSVPLSLSCDTDASPQEPFLAVSVRFDMTVFAELSITDVDDRAYAETINPLGIVSAPLDAELADTTVRLLRALTSPIQARVLAPTIVRELCLRALTGPKGREIRAALTGQSGFGRIARALHRIHTDYASKLDVGSLAREAGMSAPAFHARFKAATSASPIQYIKSVRLHQARLLMIRDDLTAAAAGARVGYGSASQFGREFKRLFGRSPGEDVRANRQVFRSRESEPLSQ